MSCNRENVTWKTAGTWSIGFFDFYETGDTSDPDWDSEWDVEYLDRFMFVSTGHPTPEAAYEAWDGANPGGTTIYDTPSPETERYDRMAAEWLAANPPRRERMLPWIPR